MNVRPPSVTTLTAEFYRVLGVIDRRLAVRVAEGYAIRLPILRRVAFLLLVPFALSFALGVWLHSLLTLLFYFANPRNWRTRIGRETSRGVARPPGWRLGAFARFWFSRKTYSLVLEPTLRDLIDEYVKALAEGQPLKARWVRWRGTFAFWSAVVNQMPVSFLRLLHRLWKAAGS